MRTLWIRGKFDVSAVQIDDEELTEQQESGEIPDQCACGDYLTESFSLEFGTKCPKCRPIVTDSDSE